MRYLIKYNVSLASINELVQKIELAVLYFVHNGRNAWHSTWVQKYRQNCFYVSLEEAKNYCENMRTNGLVFYIIETPALMITSNKNNVYFLTQINTSEPLAGYSSNAIISKELYKGNIIENAQDNYIKLGNSLKAIFLSFDKESRFWWKKFDESQKVIILISTEIIDSGMLPLAGNPLKSYKSISYGKKYYLGWIDYPIKRKSDSIIKLVDEANNSSHDQGLSDQDE